MIMCVWILVLWLISLTAARELNMFPEYFVVAERNDPDPVTLACRTGTHGAVTWQFAGKEVQLGDSVRVDGQNLKVSQIDTPMLGEYSCWRGQNMLSSVHLFLRDEEDEDVDQILDCRAKSYDCSFRCRWKDKSFPLVRLGLGHDCSEGQRSCQWNSSPAAPEGELDFVLTHSLSPYAEEAGMMEVTVEAIHPHAFVIMRRTKSFYLRDIVQPDSPQIQCREAGENLNVSIKPPSTWSTPHSYFSLEHEIEYESIDDGKVERSLSTLIPRRISRLRARSRDPLVQSAWSQWTDWKNAGKEKKGNLCRRRKNKIKKPALQRRQASTLKMDKGKKT